MLIWAIILSFITWCYSTSLYANSGKIESLKRGIKEIINERGGHGAGIAVVTKDRIIWASGIGTANVEKQQEVHKHTVFQVASVSKIFVALALIKLSEKGLIDLNANFKDIAPEIKINNPYSATHPIKINHLLEHTTGIQEVIAKWYDDSFPQYMSAKQILDEYIRPVTLRWPPGDTVTYSNYNYILISYLIEKITGQRFDDHIYETMFKPLGMENSKFRLSRINPDLLAKGYRVHSNESLPHVEGFYRTSAGLSSSPYDLARFMQMLLNDGKLGKVRITNKKILDYMETPRTSLAARNGLQLGHGPGSVARQTNGRIVMGHGGAIDGFVSTFYYNRQLGVGYVILLNSHLFPTTPSRTKIGNLIWNTFFSDYKFEQDPKITLSEEILKKYEGFYQYINIRFAITEFVSRLDSNKWIFVKNGRLYQKKLFGEPKELVPVGQNKFRRVYELKPSIVFGTTDDGQKFMHKLINTFYIKTSPLWPMALVFTFVFCLIIILTTPLYGLSWIIYSAFKGLKSGSNLWAKILPILAAFAFILIFVFVLCADISKTATTFNFVTFGIFISSILFCVLSFLSLPVSLFALIKNKKTLILVYSFIISLCCTLVTLYTLYYKLIGVKLWDYS